MLTCPRCAAPVADSAKTCAHCAAPLLLRSCGRCLSRAFHGHKHCPACGAPLADAAAGEARGDRPCPRCATAMQRRPIGDLSIDECGACHGVFLDHDAVERVVTDRQQARADAILAAVPRAELHLTPPGGRMYVKCPVCATVMNRRQFKSGAGVVIDVCKAHGVFFDPGELPAILDFVMNGGLEEAEKKELHRQREALRRERESAQFTSMMAARSSTHAREHARDVTAADALVDLLRTLWR
jgi:Zn-finger nucleic acid-binding protein